MPEIVLATLNAKYEHASLGLRCLFANLGDLQPRAVMREFTARSTPVEMAEALLELEPRIVGFGVYIWNVAALTELVSLLKRLRPELVIVLGGPEVSHETSAQEIVRVADFVIVGEGDLAFARLSSQVLEGCPPDSKIIPASLPELATLALPYGYYSDADVRDRVVYVEASRGCPYRCEFCLSSLDKSVRAFPLQPLLSALDGLLSRGVTRFKFVDRTFNLRIETSRTILAFFLERLRPGLFVHFEMIPDRLPSELRELVARFPEGALQFEIGIQTLDEEVSARISRHQDHARLRDNFAFLRAHTGVHLHADLIIGLPGEDMATFARGFDQVVALRPHEVQVGMLKRLRGTPIIRHEREFGLVFNPAPPYEILQTREIHFASMQRLRRFARYWELLHNSGNFKNSLPRIWERRSPFEAFLALSDWLYARLGRAHGIALDVLTEQVLDYLVEVGHAREVAGALVATDYFGGVPRRVPPFLASWAPSQTRSRSPPGASLPRRQSRHVVTPEG